MILVVVITSVLAAVVYWRMIVGPPTAAGLQAKRLRQELLCKTDLNALLEACRVLSKRVRTGELSPATYWVRAHPHSVATGFPEIIILLRPAYVRISEDGVVRLEMGDRWGAFGVYAYPNGYEKHFPNPKYGDRQLLDGLWYYDDNYLYLSNYDEEIDTIVKSCREGKNGV